jgi:predicted nucleic acid-binding protein
LRCWRRSSLGDQAPPARERHRRDAAATILESLQSHIEPRFIRQAVNDSVIDFALEIIDRYALRAYDAIQLAGCLALCAITAEAFTFVCSDQRLVEAARSQQLKVLNPAE